MYLGRQRRKTKRNVKVNYYVAQVVWTLQFNTVFLCILKNEASVSSSNPIATLTVLPRDIPIGSLIACQN